MAKRNWTRGIFSLLEGSRAERVETEALSGVNNSQLSRKSKNGTLTGRVRQLRRGGTHQSDHARRVDDASLGLAVLSQATDSMLAAEPHALDINVLGQVPDVLGTLLGVAVLCVHDTGIVEHDVDTAPGVEVADGGLNIGFFGYVDDERLELALSCGDDLLDLGERLVESGGGDVGDEDGGAFLAHQDGRLEANSSAFQKKKKLVSTLYSDFGVYHVWKEVFWVDTEETVISHLPSGTSDDGILARKSSRHDFFRN